MEEKDNKKKYECYLCLKTPKLMERFSCGHVICENCLLRCCLKLSRQNSTTDSDLILICEKCDNGPTLNANDFVAELMYEKNILYKQQLCEGCEETHSSLVCEECEIQLCHNCFDSFHKLNKSFSNHSVSKKTQITDENIDKILDVNNNPLSAISVVKTNKNSTYLLNQNKFNSSITDIKNSSSKLSIRERKRSIHEKNKQEEKIRKLQAIKNNELIISHFKKLFKEFTERIICSCPLKKQANFLCEDCNIKICEVCILTNHKYHKLIFEVDTQKEINKYENQKFLEEATQNSLDEGLSPRNETIKY